MSHYFSSRLYTNYNYIQKSSFLYPTHSNLQGLQNLFLNMSLSTYTRSGSNEKIAISNEVTTIPTSPSHFFTKYILDTKIQNMFDHPKEHFYKQHEELVNFNSDAPSLSEDNKVIKETTNKFSSKPLNKIIICIHLPNTLKKLLITCVLETELAEKLRHPNRKLKQQLK